MGALTASQGLFRPLRQKETREQLAGKLRDCLEKQKMLYTLPQGVMELLDKVAPPATCTAPPPPMVADSSDESVRGD